MSQLPVKGVVNVQISISPEAPARQGFGTLNVITKDNVYIGNERTRYYSGIDEVGADWSTQSEAYKAAQTYFAQKPSPTSLAISVRYDTVLQSELAGAKLTDAAATHAALVAAAADGQFNLSLNGVDKVITVGDMTNAADLDACAQIIETAINAVATKAATFTYDATTTSFSCKIGDAVGDAVGFMSPSGAGTYIGAILSCDEVTGASEYTLSPEETITQSLVNILDGAQDWYGYMFTKEVRDTITVNGEEDAVTAAAVWGESNGKWFFNTSNDPKSIVLGDQTCIGYRFNDKFEFTSTEYSSFPNQYPAASAAGKAFSWNPAQPNSHYTMKFKKLPVITHESIGTNAKKALDEKRMNAYVSVGGNLMYAEGVMASTLFMDERHGIDWLQNAIETNVFGYMYTRVSKVAGTDRGVASLEQQVVRGLDEAINNGLGAPGFDDDGVFYPRGYATFTTPLNELPLTPNRNYDGLSFIIIGAGAIHGLTISATFNR